MLLINILTLITTVIIVIGVWLGIGALYTWFLIKRSATELDQKEFYEKSRNQQLIDTREHDNFVKSHIIGARNFPYFQLKEIGLSLQKNRPVYVYSQNRVLESRAANQLRKQGYTEIYILKGGYDNYDGRTKASK